MRKLKATVVDAEQIKSEVIRANMVVRTQFFSLGPRHAPTLASISDPQESSRMLTREIEQICNDLACGTEKYADEQGRCLLCGVKKEEAE